jgi:RNA polymerase sigma-70 factor, ECF subfamily
MKVEELPPAVVLRCIRQDPVAFRLLVSRYESAVFACVSRVLGGVGDVEDLAQETFLRAFRAFPTFDPAGPARVSTWLLTIATRLALDVRRRHRTSGAIDPGLWAPTSPDPEAALQRHEERAGLVEAIALLDDDQRAAFVLFTFHDRTIAEIASALGVQEATVKTRLHRARSRLRDALRRDGATSPVRAKDAS